MPKKVAGKALVKKGSANKQQVAKGRTPEEASEEEVLATSPMEVGRMIRVSQSSFRSGPLPSARDFAAYNKGVSDAAERILRMAEKNQRAMIEVNSLGQKRFFILVLTLVPFVLVALVIVALFSSNTFAIISLGGLGSVVASVGGLIYYGLGRRK